MVQQTKCPPPPSNKKEQIFVAEAAENHKCTYWGQKQQLIAGRNSFTTKSTFCALQTQGFKRHACKDMAVDKKNLFVFENKQRYSLRQKYLLEYFFHQLLKPLNLVLLKTAPMRRLCEQWPFYLHHHYHQFYHDH